MKTLCLGEALVDLICERPARGLSEADAFVPHFGGAIANVAVNAARHGGAVALASGAGDDAWGHWLRARLEGEGVDITWFALLRDAPTAVAFVTVDGAGEPAFLIYGDAIAAAMEAFAARLDEAVAACDALFFASNTLVGERDRAVSMTARARALELGRPLVFDPNLRLNRWPGEDAAARAARACLAGAFLVKCNRSEARLLTGEDDPGAGAQALLALGARNVVVTLGADGALLRGEAGDARAPGVHADPIDATGAGDTVTGVLVAALSRAGYDAAALADALPQAVAAAARTTERFGAV